MGLPKDSGINLYPKYEAGSLNLITDVAGVKVGQVTHRSEDHKVNTGVTVIIPHEGNVFRDKLFAASSVINGFGKAVGLVQVEELGTLESPIFLTNTLSVGTVLTAGVKYSLQNNPEIGMSTGTVNVVVGECNDSVMNDIRGFHVTEEDVFEAIGKADSQFEEGAVGSGTGMMMMDLKGGIGSASRLFKIGDKTYTAGALVMTNYGSLANLTVGGDHIGRRIDETMNGKDKGSCILVIATDAPLIDRQLKRVANRAAHALARTGSYSGNGSGDVAIAFSTANKLAHFNTEKTTNIEMLYDEELDTLFEACVEAMEEALVSSVYHADTMEGFKGKTLHSLRDFL